MRQANNYPARKPHHAHRLVRLLFKACVAQDLGAPATLLVIAIAHQEDACRYKRAVTFWDGQLMAVLGITSRSTLAKIRARAVESGWLHYEPGQKGRVARYWTLIPEHADGLSDAPIEEGHDAEVAAIPESSTTPEPDPVRDPVQKMDRIADRIETGSEPDRDRIARTSCPIPIPIPERSPPARGATDPASPEPVDDFTPLSSTALAHGFNWLTIEADFIRDWNSTANTCKISFSAMPADLVRGFRESWMTPGWPERAGRGLARIPGCYKPVSLRQFLVPSFLDELLGGVHDRFERLPPAADGKTTDTTRASARRGDRRGGGALPGAARVDSPTSDYERLTADSPVVTADGWDPLAPGSNGRATG